jgi:hypothetical protein
MRQATGLGRFVRGTDATRGTSLNAKGSGAPAIGFLLAALASLFVLAFAAAPALAAESDFEFVEAFGPDGTSASGFGGGGLSVAVDQQADLLYALDAGANILFKFDLEGNPVNFGGSGPDISGNELSGLSIGSGGGVSGSRQVAVDSTSHTIYLTGENGAALQAFQANGEPALFTAGPGEGTNSITGFPELRGVAVDSNGSIYVAGSRTNGSISGDVTVFAASGAEILPRVVPSPSYPPGILFIEAPLNIAVDAEGILYPLQSFGKASRYSPSEFPVTPNTTYSQPGAEYLDPNQAAGIAVDPTTNDVYVAEGGSFNPIAKVAVYDEGGSLQTTFAGPGEEGQLDDPTGIAVEGEGQERVFVANSPDAGLVQVKVFKRLEGEPTITSTALSDVTAESATLRARINPHGSATTYHFEYGLEDCALTLSACTSVPLGGAGIGAGHNPVAVSQLITGLEAGTTYHYRVVAENSLGDPVESPDRTFTTQLRGLGFELADNRAWEMVSPPKKHGGSIFINGTILQAAADGNGLIFPSLGAFDPDAEGSRAPDKSANLARRGDGGWHSEDITPPHTRAAQVGLGLNEYRMFSPDLGRAVVDAYDDTPLSPQTSERTIYLRENTNPPAYTPLVTGKEGFANVPAGTVFGGGGVDGPWPMETLGANAALTHVVFTSAAPLVAGALPASLYQWAGGQLQLINQLPAGGATPALLGSGQASVRNAVSADGSRVFWGAASGTVTTTALYVRNTETEEVVRLDVAQPGASGPGVASPFFHAASADGAVVFFTDSRQLTADASPEGRDLYRCEVSFDETTPGCSSLTDISAPLVGSGESSEVQGMSSAITNNGTHVYFVARGELDTAPNEGGNSAISGEPNLYLWREGEGVRFIATLSEGDARDWAGRVFSITAAASPSGRYFSFMSERSLSGDENRDAISGEPLEEVFSYDALADSLQCVSCNPTGANPVGERQSLGGVGQLPSRDPHSLWSNRWVAAMVPEALKGEVFGGSSFHRPRYTQDSGRVFFNAIDALVPADSNGEWDAYQYEPLGVGDCSASSGSASISRSAGGCVSLISSGTGEKEAAFLDAGTSGGDAFFVTPARLSVLDEDSELDIYDARVDGVPERLAPNTECLGEACQPAAIAPNDPTPASAAFKGQGNVKSSPRKRCAKGKRKVRRGGKARCVSRKHKRQNRASKSRRAGR